MSNYHRPPSDINEMSTLKVDNLTFRTTPEQLKKVFDKFGEIGDVYIPRDHRTKESRGFAFVRFYERDDAEDAMDELDGYMMDGRPLRVAVARYSRPRRDPRHGRNGYGNRNRDRNRSRSRSRSRSRDRRRRSRSRSRDRRRRSSRDRSRDRSQSKSRSRTPKDDAKGSKDRSKSPKERSKSPEEKASSKSPPPARRGESRTPSKSPDAKRRKSKSRSRSPSRSRSRSDSR